MNKSRLEILLMVLFLSCAFISFAGQPEPSPVYLSSYSFSPDHARTALCRVMGYNVNQYTPALTGANADLFKLKKNELFLTRRGRKYFKKFNRVDVSLSFASENKRVMERTFTLLKGNFAANQVVAHRGAWKNTALPQNSIASLQAAIKLGCAGSEFDIQLTADTVLVINHDPTYQGMGIERSN
jgi:glycerophosphoryl diester phosphodiesterase